MRWIWYVLSTVCEPQCQHIHPPDLPPAPPGGTQQRQILCHLQSLSVLCKRFIPFVGTISLLHKFTLNSITIYSFKRIEIIRWYISFNWTALTCKPVALFPIQELCTLTR